MARSEGRDFTVGEQKALRNLGWNLSRSKARRPDAPDEVLPVDERLAGVICVDLEDCR